MRVCPPMACARTCCRYAPGCTYRPHLDGSWPGSGVRTTTTTQPQAQAQSGGFDGFGTGDGGREEYVHDAWGDRRSRLTFLVYLNEVCK